jgi:hypothetical protein
VTVVCFADSRKRLVALQTPMGSLQNVKICATVGRICTRSCKKDYTNENDGSEQAPQILWLCLSLQALCRARLHFPGVCGNASHPRHWVATEWIAGLQWTWILGFHANTLRLSAPALALACHARTALELSRGMRVDTPHHDRRHLGTV